MILTVRLFGNLRERLKQDGNGDSIRCELDAGATVSDLLQKLGIPAGSQPVVIQDKRVMQKGDLLEECREVRILQPLDGG